MKYENIFARVIRDNRSAVVEQLNIMNYEFTGSDKQNPPENSQIKRFIKLDMNNLASVSDICDMVLDAENNGRINIINCAGYDANHKSKI